MTPEKHIGYLSAIIITLKQLRELMTPLTDVLGKGKHLDEIHVLCEDVAISIFHWNERKYDMVNSMLLVLSEDATVELKELSTEKYNIVCYLSGMDSALTSAVGLASALLDGADCCTLPESEIIAMIQKFFECFDVHELDNMYDPFSDKVMEETTLKSAQKILFGNPKFLKNSLTHNTCQPIFEFSQSETLH